jgi:4-diphosphocytidyl-2-C-methyl-D-erythritol kinase
MVIENAPAKVNLFLHVGQAKPNGRHDLDSLVVFSGADAADRVQLAAAQTLSLTVTGPTSFGLETGADNLVLRAASALRQQAGVESGAVIELDKHLPVAAGIGGGSSDAAATLRGLSDLWGLSMTDAAAVAPALGGDVPASLLNAPCLMRGEGERVRPVVWPEALPALLVNPGVPCSTGAVFDAFDAAGGGANFREAALPKFPLGRDGRDALIHWLSAQRNDLELAARQVQPAVADVLDALEKVGAALLTRMSGSGATCFALFDTWIAAQDAEAAMRSARPDWWSRATVLGAGA